VTAPRHALVLADGSAPDPSALDVAWPGWTDGIDLVIAADGGARHAERLGRRLDRWVGDADSIGEDGLAELARSGVAVDRHPVDKDETDTELAVRAAAAAGVRRLTILGALGGERIDHELGNLWLLAMPALEGIAAFLLDPAARIRLAGPGRIALGGRVGDLVSLLPFGGDVEGITTRGLRYPLRDEPLVAGPARGLSNVREATDAAVDVRTGRILVIATPARL
jgi:thiamine pyrophosphokinase